MISYKVLRSQTFHIDDFRIVPIRKEDRYKIMRWRNEQIYHLRQAKPLSKKDQDLYFETVVENLFAQEKPDQILFSFLKEEELIGYGGLVHINWRDKNAEISFIMDTELEVDYFIDNWVIFLQLIERVAFNDLDLHKIFTYAFDIRPKLYTALEKAGFGLEAELKEHCFFEEKFINVKIHSKRNTGLELRKVAKSDLETTFNWAINPSIRAFSFNSTPISFEEHVSWFLSKVRSEDCVFYILEVNGIPAGSIRFDVENGSRAKISYLIDPNFTGKGMGTAILDKGMKKLKKERPNLQILYGWVLQENKASKKIFEKLLFKESLKNGSKIKYEKEII